MSLDRAYKAHVFCHLIKNNISKQYLDSSAEFIKHCSFRHSKFVFDGFGRNFNFPIL